jgi:predicted negative regulator of RcsB-dependent stress response
MAEPAAVPGVDPSRVNTPDELAACLEGLRLRRGLSYEVMEKAAARLLSRSGRSQLEPLPKSTVGEIVRGKRLPAKGKLLTFLEVCGVAQADLAQWLAAWERASTADLARPAGAVRVREARPRLLGVHAAISVPGVPDDGSPHYVPRDVDAAEFGIRARVRVAAQAGGFVLLVGGSSVGKTRCAFEAVKALLPEWWLVHPAGPTEVNALAQVPPLRTVVWLDELQRYLDGERGLTGGAVRALLNGPHPIVIIGTLWPDRYAAYIVPAPGGTDPHAREREVLDLAAVIRIAAEFSPAEQDRARAAAARDRRLAAALETAGHGLPQTLAAAPQLVARWQDAKVADPYAWAVLTAALDVARLGARAPLSADLLRAAAPGYCTSRQQAEAPINWFQQALAYATEKLRGAAAALSPVGAGMGQVAGYTVADYLLQHAGRERRTARVPASTWDTLPGHIHDPADCARLADGAMGRLLYRYAIPLYQHVSDANASDKFAASQLVRLLADRGDLDGLRARADAGDENAAERLVHLLFERGDLDGLRIMADTGDEDATLQLAVLLADRGDLDGLRARADAGDAWAALKLADLLADRGDIDGALQILRAQADTGDGYYDGYAVGWLVRLLAGRGDVDGLRARADAGDGYATSWLADLLAKRGDIDGALQILRARADAGDENAAQRLAGLLADRGDLDGLRARADAGDGYATSQLTGLLADRGDMDGLCTIANAGHKYAASRLADLLADRGDLDGAVQILRTLADPAWDAARRLADLLARRGDVDGLRARADAGDEYAASRLTDLLADRGDIDGTVQILRARADAGDENAARRLADLLARRGDVDGLRTMADAGNSDAASRLAFLLSRRGDIDGLRARVDTSDAGADLALTRLLADRGDVDGLRARLDARDEYYDPYGAARLADLLAGRGDLDGAEQILRTMADAGVGDVDRLAALLTEQGRGEETEQLRRFGLNPDGSVACG